ncbi:hypothetical protein [Sphingomonas sp. BK580]|uniref:hypothetical protein n=1 Tax=Sphingomonas sp. BK580 TaxID=2586972 RepID=UPI0016106133|nr:hypothetical protein [Sphingomonas sp. BK580]MBB3693041.1 hypothetical protein [Sphingomonas sp. BK580]
MLDPNTNYQTRSGLRARIVSDQLGGDYPLGVLVTLPDGRESFASYTAEGREWTDRESPSDLITPPVVRVQYCNQLRDGSLGTVADYVPTAPRGGSSGRIAILRIETQIEPSILPPVFSVHEAFTGADADSLV